MQSPRFNLLPGTDRAVIVSPGTDMRIAVYQLGREPFNPSPGELQFYGVAGDQSFAFETDCWGPIELDLVSAAISWYAQSVGCGDLVISLDPPQVKRVLRIVR